MSNKPDTTAPAVFTIQVPGASATFTVTDDDAYPKLLSLIGNIGTRVGGPKALDDARFFDSVPWLSKKDAAGRTFRASDNRHGTEDGYIRAGCRCSTCEQAWKDYLAISRRRRLFDMLGMAGA